jgi:hypothetical protein
MPIIDFTMPFYLLSGVVLFVLCLYLATKNKTNTIPCIMLLVAVAILAGHSIELAYAISTDTIMTLVKNIVFDEMFIFISFLSFLWLDKIQVENMKKKTNKAGKKDKLSNKVIEKDGLDMLWKKV